jgi:hypothetical protein
MPMRDRRHGLALLGEDVHQVVVAIDDEWCAEQGSNCDPGLVRVAVPMMTRGDLE